MAAKKKSAKKTKPTAPNQRAHDKLSPEDQDELRFPDPKNPHPTYQNLLTKPEIPNKQKRQVQRLLSLTPEQQDEEIRNYPLSPVDFGLFFQQLCEQCPTEERPIQLLLNAPRYHSCVRFSHSSKRLYPKHTIDLCRDFRRLRPAFPGSLSVLLSLLDALPYDFHAAVLYVIATMGRHAGGGKEVLLQYASKLQERHAKAEIDTKKTNAILDQLCHTLTQIAPDAEDVFLFLAAQLDAYEHEWAPHAKGANILISMGRMGDRVRSALDQIRRVAHLDYTKRSANEGITTKPALQILGRLAYDQDKVFELCSYVLNFSNSEVITNKECVEVALQTIGKYGALKEDSPMLPILLRFAQSWWRARLAALKALKKVASLQTVASLYTLLFQTTQHLRLSHLPPEGKLLQKREITKGQANFLQHVAEAALIMDAMRCIKCRSKARETLAFVFPPLVYSSLLHVYQSLQRSPQFFSAFLPICSGLSLKEVSHIFYQALHAWNTGDQKETQRPTDASVTTLRVF